MSKFTSKIASVGLTAITVVSLSGFAVLPAAAATSTDIQAQITALLAQIQSLQSQLGTGTSTSTTAYTFTRNLTVGSKGDDVTALQNYLKSTGNFTGTATGYFGSVTKAAVAAWQTANKVSPASGYFGAVSKAKYTSLVSSAGTGTTTGTTTTTTGGSLSVALASGTPAAGSIAKSAKVSFSRMDFTAGSSPVTVNSLVATRIGLSSDSDVSNVYLYNHTTNTQLAVGSFNNGRVTFTGSPLFTVNANSTFTISIRADMASGGTTGDSIGYGIASAADVASFVGTTPVSEGGTFPVNGNLMTIAAVSNLGALQVLSAGTVIATQPNPGTLATNVGYFQLSGSNQPLSVTYLKLTNVGSVAATDIQNIKLFNGTTQVGTTMQQAADKTVTFDLSSSPLLIPSGNSVNLYVRGDITGGSNRTFQFTIQRTSDISVTDTIYNTGIVPGLGSATGTSPVPTGTVNQATVQAGTSIVQVDTTSPTGNIATGALSQTLATFSVTATGEDIRFSQFKTSLNLSGGTVTNPDYFKNGKLIADGTTQVGSTQNMNMGTTSLATAAQQTTFSIPGYWVVPAGTTHKISIVADVVAGTTTAANLNNAVVTAEFVGAGTTAQGANSLSAPTFSDSVGRALTITTGALTSAVNNAFVVPTAAMPTGVPGQTGVRIASFTLTAGSSEAENISSVTLTGGAGLAQFQNLVLKANGVQVGQVQGGTLTTTTYTFSPTTTLQVPAGGAVTLDVYADILSTGTGTSLATVSLTSVVATGAVDNVAPAAITSRTGQAAWIVANGTLTVSADSQAPTVAQLQQLVMGSTQQTLAVFNFAASSAEAINVTKIIMTDNEASTNNGIGDIQNIKLYVAGVAVCNGLSVPSLTTVDATHASATFNLQSCPIVVPANSNVSVYVKADISAYPNGVSGATHNINLAAGDATHGVTSLGAVSAASGGTSAAVTGVTGTVYRSALTGSVDATSPAGLSSSSATQTVGVFNLTNSANSANSQALVLPTSANFNSKLQFTISSTLPIVAAKTRTFTVYKSTDLATAVLQAPIVTGASVAGTWNGTLSFTNTNGVMTSAFTPSGSNDIGNGAGVVSNATATNGYILTASVVLVPQTINAGQTVQYVVKFDTTDRSATGQTFTLSIPTQGSNNMWADGATAAIDAVTTINGLPLTFSTLQY